MRAMGVDAGIINLSPHEQGFREAYPDLDIPVTYVDVDQLKFLVKDYDAVIATFNPCIGWLTTESRKPSKTILGYYVQDFEPYFYPVDSDEYRKAWTYTLIQACAIDQTEWTQRNCATRLV
jgi:hypothetical protein